MEGTATKVTMAGALTRTGYLGDQGCFVHGKYHRANTRHPRDEVTAAINRLKQKTPICTPHLRGFTLSNDDDAKR